MSNFIYAILTLLAIALIVYWGFLQKGILEFIIGVLIFCFVTFPWIMNLLEKDKK